MIRIPSTKTQLRNVATAFRVMHPGGEEPVLTKNKRGIANEQPRAEMLAACHPRSRRGHSMFSPGVLGELLGEAAEKEEEGRGSHREFAFSPPTQPLRLFVCVF